MSSGEFKDDIGLRSSEVREVMNRVPPAILRWGVSVIAVIAAIGIGVIIYLDIPITRECDFTLSWVGDNRIPNIIIEIPPSAIQAVMAGDKSVMLSAEAFPGAFVQNLSATITHVDSMPGDNGTYQAMATLTSDDMIRLLGSAKITIVGKAYLTVGRRTLLEVMRLERRK